MRRPGGHRRTPRHFEGEKHQLGPWEVELVGIQFRKNPTTHVEKEVFPLGMEVGSRIPIGMLKRPSSHFLMASDLHDVACRPPGRPPRSIWTGGAAVGTRRLGWVGRLEDVLINRLMG